MQSSEMPLLFKFEWVSLWRNTYELYYRQPGGKLYGFVLFQFNVQRGAGRNSVSLTLLNVNFIASWNARYAQPNKVIEMPQQAGPQQVQVDMPCFLCHKPAKAVTPICEECVKEKMGEQVNAGKAN